jgi:beta-phosphoglucomutase
MDIKAVIFDLDGVICSTDKYHFQAWKAIADKEGIYFDEKINNELRGVSRMDSLEIILKRASRKYSQAEKEALAEEKNKIYREFLKKMTPSDVSEDVLKTIDELKARKIPTAIGSSSKNTLLILSQIGLISSFDVIVDGNDITHSKPNPEVFLLAAKRLQKDPSSCLVVEDAKAGIDAAASGGFRSAGISDAALYAKTENPIRKISDILKLF